ncbi:MAG: hypothetical protein EBT03_08150 [Betaproteobacteria bacterium]|nr:hypothetical protein [Betaproteobacteria bacterium]NCA17158.1 hypothetical protein [Betaproteobacteria bacterium]
MLKESTVRLLRSLVNEVLKLTIEPVDSTDTSKAIGKPEVRLINDDDDIDELMYQLNRFDFRALKYDDRSDPELTPESSKDLDTIVTALVGPQHVSKMHEVIAPWGQVGYDILQRVLVASIRTDKEFPFFLSYDDVTVGRTINFPTTPTAKVVHEITSAKSRIGKSDTGKGELLFALMTGATPPDNDVGDMVVNGAHWEIKDVRSSPIIRLGGLHSQAFMKEVMAWCKPAGKDYEEVRKNIRSAKASDKSYWPALSVMLKRVLKETTPPLAGIVVVEPVEGGQGRFRMLSTDVVDFYSTSKDDRVHFKVNEAQKSAEAEAMADLKQYAVSKLGQGAAEESD